jgi:hypothetical protein
MTFEQIRNLARAIGPLLHGSLADRVDDVLDRARINADDTCYVEKSVPEGEYDSIALASVECVLSERDTDADVIAWFASHGVKA